MIQWIRRIFLSPFSLIYWITISIRNFLYDRGFFPISSLPGQVISIGNIEVGGTGKTPMTLALASFLLSKGKRVAILTRGYKSGMANDIFSVLKGDLVVMGQSEHFADEAKMLANILKDVPVIVGARRHTAATSWLATLSEERFPEYWILDDGFQHRKVKRDFDIVLIKSRPRFGFLDLLPGGNFRETSSSLKRATLCLDSPSATDCKVEVLRQANKPNKYFVICGIARPEAFFESCRKTSLNCFGFVSVGDHNRIDSNYLTHLPDDVAILTTEKDYYRDLKLWGTLNRTICVIPFRADLPDQLKKMF